MSIKGIKIQLKQQKMMGFHMMRFGSSTPHCHDVLWDSILDFYNGNDINPYKSTKIPIDENEKSHN